MKEIEIKKEDMREERRIRNETEKSSQPEQLNSYDLNQIKEESKSIYKDAKKTNMEEVKTVEEIDPLRMLCADYSKPAELTNSLENTKASNIIDSILNKRPNKPNPIFHNKTKIPKKKNTKLPRNSDIVRKEIKREVITEKKVEDFGFISQTETICEEKSNPKISSNSHVHIASPIMNANFSQEANLMQIQM